MKDKKKIAKEILKRKDEKEKIEKVEEKEEKEKKGEKIEGTEVGEIKVEKKDGIEKKEEEREERGIKEREEESLEKKKEREFLGKAKIFERKIFERMPQARKEVKFFALFRPKRTIPFLKYRKVAFIYSLVMTILGVLSIFKIHLGPDFKGGTFVRIKSQSNIDDLRKIFPDAQIQEMGKGEFLINIPLSTVEKMKLGGKDPGSFVVERVKGAEVLSVESVGASIGKELRRKGVLAGFLALLGIFIYAVFRFEWRFAIGAILSLIHDAAFALLIMSIFKIELSITTLSAIIAMLGYSINDSIIIADRVREKLRTIRGIWTEDMFNSAITETLSRTIITSLLTFFPTIALLIFGTDVLKGFASIFLAGIITGTYSSIFVVSAVAFEIYSYQIRRREVESRRGVLRI